MKFVTSGFDEPKGLQNEHLQKGITMKSESSTLFAVSLVIALAVPMAAQANEGPAAVTMPSTATTGAPRYTVGIVKKVDAEAGKVTINHGPLENLGMPGMTMIFRVADASWIGQLKEGQKINFVAEKINGAFTVVQLEAVK